VAIPDISDDRLLAELPSLQSIYEAALTSRPEIERLQLAIKSSDVSLSIAKAGWLPNLSMTAGVSTSTNSLANNNWGSQMKANVNASAGFQLSVPIWDGRSTKTAVNKAKINQLQAQLDLQDQEKTLYHDLQQYWVDALTNQQKYLSAGASVESAQESYDLLSEQFRLGLKNIVELLTGKDKLLQAQQNRLQSKYTALYNEQMLQFYQSGVIK
jgi:outer membrane protein